MRFLLDTPALIWWLADSPRLTTAARKVIAQTTNAIYVSAASACEIATKVRIGKLSDFEGAVSNIDVAIEEERFQPLEISVQNAIRAGSLPGPHRDPFDRMLIAQAQAENLVLISHELIFDSYGVKRLW